MKVRWGKEVYFTTPNETGTLGKITSAFTTKNINLLGVCAYGETKTNQGTFMVYTETPETVTEVVRSFGYTPTTNDVLVIELTNKPGAINEGAQKLAKAGIDVNYTYCTSTPTENTALWIVSTNNNKKAFDVLK